mmetsp:Transcript_5725/g.9821  ORF Transcript_5725/g.9821 Transcript_5725/m.9821 type:complete len:102 (+) Transcript_5725:396-701(+)|eukprot:CAMPEP_0168609932 /NCGR_PEP_ID=MMETSP0449_2-20121227/1491_1 /TAXON_ID=1082188 /ORGANISM="Strombidium rassoulzadegani, Strain ras09" /LENGTH=101 /DNA_ID=CAMNT_0008650151 /DNA_START=301 /DNA_END=606 /DNA_ORIENTATION=+
MQDSNLKGVLEGVETANSKLEDLKEAKECFGLEDVKTLLQYYHLPAFYRKAYSTIKKSIVENLIGQNNQINSEMLGFTPLEAQGSQKDKQYMKVNKSFEAD